MLTNDNMQRERFIEQNLPLVHSLAHRYTGRGVEYDDLFAAGSLLVIIMIAAIVAWNIRGIMRTDPSETLAKE